MDEQIQVMAEAAADQVLSRFKREHPEWVDNRTPIDQLVHWLGLQVETFHPNDYPPGTYGMLEPEEDLIWLCRDLPETLRRFTLAHELGHAILHRPVTAPEHFPSASFHLSVPSSVPQNTLALSREDLCHNSDVQEEIMELLDSQQVEEATGLGPSYSPRSQRELAANIFAAALLIPLERVRSLYLTYLTSHISVDKLAALFGVSTTALLHRLVGLLTLKASVPVEPQEDASALSAPQEPTKPAAKKQYDEFQQAAIEASTPALIVAGPGSGKTSTLIGRADYLINTRGIAPQHILALTFSRKAAQEMQERLQQVLTPRNVGVPLAGTLALPTVSTFHAFCAELLRTYGHLVGLRPDFTLVDEAEGYFLLRRQARSMRLRHYRDLWTPTRFFPDMLKAISRARDELVTPEQYRLLAQRMREEAQAEDTEMEEAIAEAEKAHEIAEVYALYQAGLEQRGDTDFGGLLLLAVQLLQNHPAVRAEQQQHYQHILVDEFQDMNRASGVLLRELAGEQQRVWVVGDANQAIYGFRGASPANIGNFQQDYPGAIILPLSRNYRSRADLVGLAEAFRSGHMEPDTQAGKNQATRPSGEDMHITWAVGENDASELDGLLEDIRRKLKQGYTTQDIVVLCRTRAMVRKVSRALSTAGLPVIERSGIADQEHIKDLLSIVMLVAEPSGMGILRAARQSEHALAQSDIEALLLAARQQVCPPGMLLLRGEAPLGMSAEGRHSLDRLAHILQALQHTPSVWSLLAHYLFVETALVRNLLTAEDTQIQQVRHILDDYTRLLHMAHHYDQWRQLEASMGIRLSTSDGAHQVLVSTDALTSPEAEGGSRLSMPSMQEQARGFLDYLRVLFMLGQDRDTRSQSAEEAEGNAGVIRVMTMHASKGLEFPVVYLPGLSSRRIPTPKRPSPISAPAGMLPVSTESALGDPHESGEACLFYVGMTRAREHLVLSYSERYGKQKAKPSKYLDVLEANGGKERVAELRWETATLAQSTGTDTLDTVDTPPTYISQPSEEFIDVVGSVALSAPAIETYQMCPRRYAYSNIYRFQQEKEASYLFQQATQRTLEALHKHKQQQQEVERATPNQSVPFLTQQEAQELYTQHWQALGGHETPFAAVYEQHGHEVIEQVRRKLAGSSTGQWELRSSFATEIAGKTVHVTVDRVEAPVSASATSETTSAQPVKFVRTRFGKQKEKPTPETREFLYARAYRQQYAGQGIELHQHNLSTGEMVPMQLTEKKEQSLYDEVEAAIRGMERHEYPAKPDPFFCPSCPFFLICPA